MKSIRPAYMRDVEVELSGVYGTYRLPTSGLPRMNKLKNWLRYPIESWENLDRCITWVLRGAIVIAFIAIAFAVASIVLQVKAVKTFTTP
jgi:hypothetical protein